MYPFITGVLIALAFRNRMVYFQTLIALCSGLIISYIFIALFQTSIQRPEMHNHTGLIAQLVRFVYTTDQPYNCFPSIRVLTSYLMLRGGHVFNRTGNGNKFVSLDCGLDGGQPARAKTKTT